MCLFCFTSCRNALWLWLEYGKANVLNTWFKDTPDVMKFLACLESEGFLLCYWALSRPRIRWSSHHILLTLSDRVVTMGCIYYLLQHWDNSAFCHTVYYRVCMNLTICTTISSVGVINRLFFVMNKDFVLYEVGTERLNIYLYSVD